MDASSLPGRMGSPPCPRLIQGGSGKGRVLQPRTTTLNTSRSGRQSPYHLNYGNDKAESANGASKGPESAFSPNGRQLVTRQPWAGGRRRVSMPKSQSSVDRHELGLSILDGSDPPGGRRAADDISLKRAKSLINRRTRSKSQPSSPKSLGRRFLELFTRSNSSSSASSPVPKPKPKMTQSMGSPPNATRNGLHVLVPKGGSVGSHTDLILPTKPVADDAKQQTPESPDDPMWKPLNKDHYAALDLLITGSHVKAEFIKRTFVQCFRSQGFHRENVRVYMGRLDIQDVLRIPSLLERWRQASVQLFIQETIDFWIMYRDLSRHWSGVLDNLVHEAVAKARAEQAEGEETAQADTTEETARADTADAPAQADTPEETAETTTESKHQHDAPLSGRSASGSGGGGHVRSHSGRSVKSNKSSKSNRSVSRSGKSNSSSRARLGTNKRAGPRTPSSRGLSTSTNPSVNSSPRSLTSSESGQSLIVTVDEGEHFPQALADFQELAHQYVEVGSPQEVNISSSVRTRALQTLKKATCIHELIEAFDSVNKEVVNLMHNNSLQFRRMIQETTTEETESPLWSEVPRSTDGSQKFEMRLYDCPAAKGMDVVRAFNDNYESNLLILSAAQLFVQSASNISTPRHSRRQRRPSHGSAMGSSHALRSHSPSIPSSIRRITRRQEPAPSSSDDDDDDDDETTVDGGGGKTF
eukprot:TRINITY_DN66746_c6_g10_i1.p1 TRINITY_DN66746_c6_g10~~TRINITY_DN66746_c6_g10_i1.p1  ORF type:complete len:725 (-),score=292.68 TRINITY_DN66746_c6_g10_i1:111-2207(-)